MIKMSNFHIKKRLHLLLKNYLCFFSKKTIPVIIPPAIMTAPPTLSPMISPNGTTSLDLKTAFITMSPPSILKLVSVAVLSFNSRPANTVSQWLNCSF